MASRSISTIIKASRQTVLQTFDFARDCGIEFALTFIGAEFDAPYPGPFDRGYMNALFDNGYERGRCGRGWFDRPPFDR